MSSSLHRDFFSSGRVEEEESYDNRYSGVVRDLDAGARAVWDELYALFQDIPALQLHMLQKSSLAKRLQDL